MPQMFLPSSLQEAHSPEYVKSEYLIYLFFPIENKFD